ncbi:laccase domain protein [Vallitalea longa]|uniref:Purine nucleoside phosphorylase n=1 Tax=Vallitalea longa TaxID=2936439 RepID=A0A9W5YFI0_9FIRM|nr:peptidoglycan editing factor PgeF [Vallitalea longa]GKX31731.1 laccase domain protein [Vallitalea longa]
MNSEVFKVNRADDLVYLTIPAFDNARITNHCFSTRLGGVSDGIFKSMNLGFNRGDLDENVRKNFEILCSSVGINYKDLVFSNQVHRDVIKVISSKDKGKGIFKESDIEGVDGLITNESKVPLVTFFADCVPLYFLDPIKKVIALTHAGWRGTVLKIAAKTINKMVSEFNCDVKDILVCIGPSIGPCCFEVDIEVVNEFRKIFDEDSQKKIISDGIKNKYLIDLWTANKLILLDVGIKTENITITDICTKCSKDEMFSHRGSNGKRGSLAAIMELK